MLRPRVDAEHVEHLADRKPESLPHMKRVGHVGARRPRRRQRADGGHPYGHHHQEIQNGQSPEHDPPLQLHSQRQENHDYEHHVTLVHKAG